MWITEEDRQTLKNRLFKSELVIVIPDLWFTNHTRAFSNFMVDSLFYFQLKTDKNSHVCRTWTLNTKTEDVTFIPIQLNFTTHILWVLWDIMDSSYLPLGVLHASMKNSFGFPFRRGQLSGINGRAMSLILIFLRSLLYITPSLPCEEIKTTKQSISTLSSMCLPASLNIFSISSSVLSARDQTSNFKFSNNVFSLSGI